MCSDQTIIVGHSVHNDLKALHFNHSCVIDTAYLYTVENEPGAAPSVRDVSEQILGIKLPDTHDSIQDARTSLYAAAQVLLYGPQRPIKRANKIPSGAQLLVHRIPDFCTDDHIHQMIVAYTQIIPVKVHPISRNPEKGSNDPNGKTSILFASQQHADLAFESIVGPNRPDKQNRSQKRIYLKGGGYVCIRQN